MYDEFIKSLTFQERSWAGKRLIKKQIFRSWHTNQISDFGLDPHHHIIDVKI